MVDENYNIRSERGDDLDIGDPIAFNMRSMLVPGSYIDADELAARCCPATPR